jgi:hypothetical protein
VQAVSDILSLSRICVGVSCCACDLSPLISFGSKAGHVLINERELRPFKVKRLQGSRDERPQPCSSGYIRINKGRVM